MILIFRQVLDEALWVAVCWLRCRVEKLVVVLTELNDPNKKENTDVDAVLLKEQIAGVRVLLFLALSTSLEAS